jgi:hypothetical protein
VANQPKKVFIRPPDNWDEMTDEQRYDWSSAFVSRLKAEQDKQPPETPSR